MKDASRAEIKARHENRLNLGFEIGHRLASTFGTANLSIRMPDLSCPFEGSGANVVPTIGWNSQWNPLKTGSTYNIFKLGMTTRRCMTRRPWVRRSSARLPLAVVVGTEKLRRSSCAGECEKDNTAERNDENGNDSLIRLRLCPMYTSASMASTTQIPSLPVEAFMTTLPAVLIVFPLVCSEDPPFLLLTMNAFLPAWTSNRIIRRLTRKSLSSFGGCSFFGMSYKRQNLSL